MQEAENFIYKSYKKNDEYKIVNLFQKVFKKKFNITKWKWIFKKNPNGRNIISLVLSKKKLIAQCASIKINFIFNNKKRKFYRIQNFMVHKNYRIKKIATKSLKFLTSKIVKNNNYIITFPNNNSIKTFLKNGFKRIFYVYTYEFSLNKKYKIKKKIDVKNSIFIKFKYEDVKFMNECLKNYDIFNLRAKNYLNWRYSINYDNYKISRIYLNKRIIGLVIAKFYKNDKSICICEMFYKKETNNSLQLLIDSTVSNFKKNKPRIIKIWSMTHFYFHKDLLRYGFKKNTFKTNVCTYKNLSKNKGIRNMYLSMGDSDVY
jgi:hypothetical protein